MRERMPMRKRKGRSTITAIWGDAPGGFTQVPNFLDAPIAGTVFSYIKDTVSARPSVLVLITLYKALLAIQNLEGLKAAGEERKNGAFVRVNATKLARTFD